MSDTTEDPADQSSFDDLDETLEVDSTPGGDRRQANPVKSNFASFEILEQIARGGMGIVFKAKQAGVDRTVALKLITAGQFANEDALQRFQIEAKSAGNLNHPNIVPIYDYGTHDGQPYLAMAYIEGGSLMDRLRDGPLPPREAAGLTVQIAEAMQHAHDRDIIHRDLKPQNILLDGDGQPRITDFGLAKHLDDGSQQTQPGEVMGTPAYMSPEQARGDTRVGPPADVYSIGATLYCLVTGRPPFQAATTLETLSQVKNRTPVSPREINPDVDVDIETICLKCLEKEPDKRYDSAGALAEDLRRYLDNRPIVARPVGRTARLGRWCRRNPLIASLLATIALLLVVGTVVSTSLAILANQREQETAEQAEIARENESQMKRQRDRADAEGKKAIRFAQESRNRLIRSHVQNAWRRVDNNDPLGALPWFAEAIRQSEADGKTDHQRRMQMAMLLKYAPKSMHTWQSKTPIVAVDLSPDGQRVLIAHSNGLARVYDTNTGKAVAPVMRHPVSITHAAFSPDGKSIVTTGENNAALLWSAKTGEALFPPMKAREAMAYAEFSRDGKRLITVSSLLAPATRVVNQKITYINPRTKLPKTLTLVRVEVPRYEIRFWNPLTGQPEMDPRTRQPKLITGRGWIQQVRLNADGSQIAAALTTRHERPGKKRSKSSNPTPDTDNWIHVWETATLKPVGKPHTTPPLAREVSFRPDGQRIAASYGKGSRGGAWLRVTTPADAKATPLGSDGIVEHLTFSPDGGTLLTVSPNRSIRLRDAGDGRLRSEIPIAGAPVTSIAFRPDSAVLTAGDEAGEVRTYDVSSGRQIGAVLPHVGRVIRLQYSSDGKRLLVATAGGQVRLWKATRSSATPDFAVTVAPTLIRARYSPDGRSLLAESGTFTLHTMTSRHRRISTRKTAVRGTESWHLADGKRLQRFASAQQAPGFKNVEVTDADEQRLVVCCSGKPKASPEVQLWNRQAGSRIGEPIRVTGRLYTAIRIPGTDRVAVAWSNTKAKQNIVQVFDVSAGKATSPRFLHPKPVQSLTASPSGRYLLSAAKSDASFSPDWQLRLFDLKKADANPVSLPIKKGASHSIAAFTPDSKRIAYDRSIPGAIDLAEVVVADVQAGRLLGKPCRHDGPITQVTFSSDGRLLLTASADGTARLWNPINGEPLSAPMRHPGAVYHAGFSPDNQIIATAGQDGSARLWDVASGEPLSPPLSAPAAVRHVAFSPKGDAIVTSCDDNRLRVYKLSSENRPAGELVKLAERLSTRRIDATGALVPIESTRIQRSAARALIKVYTPEN